MMSNRPSGLGTTRREALKRMLLISVPTLVTLLGASEIIGTILRAKTQDITKATHSESTFAQSQTLGSASTTSSSSTVSTSNNTLSRIGALADYTIKVAYF